MTHFSQDWRGDEQAVIFAWMMKMIWSFERTNQRIFWRRMQYRNGRSGEDALEVLEELSAEQTELPIVIAEQIMPGMKGDDLCFNSPNAARI